MQTNRGRQQSRSENLRTKPDEQKAALAAVSLHKARFQRPWMPQCASEPADSHLRHRAPAALGSAASELGCGTSRADPLRKGFHTARQTILRQLGRLLSSRACKTCIQADHTVGLDRFVFVRQAFRSSLSLLRHLSVSPTDPTQLPWLGLTFERRQKQPSNLV